MPAMYQGVRLNEGSEPIPNLNPPEGSGLSQQRSKLRSPDSFPTARSIRPSLS